MSDLNKVFLIGRLGKDPDIRYTQSGDPIANMSIATSKRWKDRSSGERKESTEWHRVVFFGRTAEICEQYLKKGAQVHVEGELQTRKWTDKDGQDRYTTEIIGRELIMLGGKNADVPAAEPAAKAEEKETADIPF